MTEYHLAQVNIAKMLAEGSDPIMAEFMNALDEINALAERTAGFVWRLQADDGNATALRVFADPLLAVNMSVWESLDALYQFTYYSDHTSFYRRRGEWFHKPTDPIMVLWWIPAGTIPTVDEAKAKLQHLTDHGPTPAAFTFKQAFTPDGQPLIIRGIKTTS